MYSYFSFIFSSVRKKVELLNISKVICDSENGYHYVKMVEKKTMYFSTSPYCTLVV